MSKVGLVLEGGSLRGLYSAGVLDIMMDNGLLDEINQLKNMGCTKDMVSMQGIGYKELLKYLDGDYSLDDAISKVKQESRRFAKRQLTWFRREKETVFVNLDELKSRDAAFEYMLDKIKKKMSFVKV